MCHHGGSCKAGNGTPGFNRTHLLLLTELQPLPFFHYASKHLVLISIVSCANQVEMDFLLPCLLLIIKNQKNQDLPFIVSLSHCFPLFNWVRSVVGDNSLSPVEHDLEL